MSAHASPHTAVEETRPLISGELPSTPTMRSPRGSRLDLASSAHSTPRPTTSHSTPRQQRRGSSGSGKGGAGSSKSKSTIYLYIAAIAAALLFIALFERDRAFETIIVLFGAGTTLPPPASSKPAATPFTEAASSGADDAQVVGDAPKQYVFVGGLQRSGTTLLSRILEQQSWTSKMHVQDSSQLDRVAELQGLTVDEIAGIFKEGGVEGKFIQDVYPYQYLLEMVGKGIAEAADLVLEPPQTQAEADRMRTDLLNEWEPFWDMSAPVLVEKSPENIFLAPLLESLFGGDTSTFVFSLRHPLVWAIVIEKWIGPKLTNLAGLPQRVELWFAAMEIAAANAQAATRSTMFNLEAVHRDDFVKVFSGEDGTPAFEDAMDLDQESKDLIDGSLSYISCWLRGLEYSSCNRRCSASHSQKWLAHGWRRSDIAARNRKMLKYLAADENGYEARANRFGYTFKAIDELFTKERLPFDKERMIHPFGSLPWSTKGCSLMKSGSKGCVRSQAMDTFDSPVTFKNGVLVAAPKLLSIANEKAINGMVQREEQMLKALSKMEGLDIHMLHYDAYVWERSENLDRFHCAKSQAHTFNGLTTREQYELAVERIKHTNVNLVASILVFTTATMNIHKEAHAADRPGGVENPVWFNGPGTNEPIQMIGNWLRQDFGPNHKIVVMTDDIHYLRSKKVLEDHEEVHFGILVLMCFLCSRELCVHWCVVVVVVVVACCSSGGNCRRFGRSL